MMMAYAKICRLSSFTRTNNKALSVGEDLTTELAI